MSIIAWLMSTFAFLMPFIFAQPTTVPETRTAPSYAEEVTDVWPTEEFETADAPWWLPVQLLRPFYTARGLMYQGSKNEGIVALYKGKIVYEWYGSGWNKDKLHSMHSATKSVTQALVGIAVEEGFIGSLQDKAVDYFPGIDIKIDAELKKDITIEQLLTMTSGLAGDFDNAFGAFLATLQTPEDEEAFNKRYEEDPLRSYLEIASMVIKPGERWNYSTISTDILMGVVAHAIDQPLKTFVDEKLFGPMGITNYSWGRYNDGTLIGGTALRMTPRDMAKFGYLYLNYGRWEDQQLVPADWVAQSAPASNLPFAYGRLFWNIPTSPVGGAYEANGANGQLISIFPECDLVIVRTGAPAVDFNITF